MKNGNLCNDRGDLPIFPSLAELEATWGPRKELFIHVSYL